MKTLLASLGNLKLDNKMYIISDEDKSKYTLKLYYVYCIASLLGNGFQNKTIWPNELDRSAS